MATTYIAVFATETGKALRLTITNGAANLSSDTASTAMEQIIASNAFGAAYGALLGKQSLQRVKTTSTAYDLTATA
jgi:hypothetical protein